MLSFIEYIPVTGEKHLGVAIIEVVIEGIGKAHLSFKESPGKDGQGTWIQSPSIKQGIGYDGKDKYIPALSLDSNFGRDKIMSFIRENVADAKGKLSAKPENVSNTYSVAKGHSQANSSNEIQMDMPF